LRQITAALRLSALLASGSEGRAGDKVAGSVRAISPSILATPAEIRGVRFADSEARQGFRRYLTFAERWQVHPVASELRLTTAARLRA
jgi:hypothetical protein